MRKEHDNSKEILINKRMKSKEMVGNDKLNIGLNEQVSKSQVKQISNELIQDNNYNTNLTKQGHEQTEQPQPIKTLETNIELKDKEVENQTKKSEREENIT